jgi:hypothetical protein
MTAIRAHFDGKIIVLDDPVKLRKGQKLIVSPLRREPMEPVRSQRKSPRLKTKKGSFFELGKNPIKLGIPDLSTNVDKYLSERP